MNTKPKAPEVVIPAPAGALVVVDAGSYAHLANIAAFVVDPGTPT